MMDNELIEKRYFNNRRVDYATEERGLRVLKRKS